MPCEVVLFAARIFKNPVESITGAEPEGRPPPPKIGKNMIFWR